MTDHPAPQLGRLSAKDLIEKSLETATSARKPIPTGKPAAQALSPIRLVLPATSANLGPAFDSAGIALNLFLTIDAELSPDFGLPLTIGATGRNADRCSRTSNNLIYETFRSVLEGEARPVPSLHLRLHNDIPLGVGCGSSASALLAGVLLANHFGALGWSLHACMEEASRREGHPDNVAACAFGYFTVAAVNEGQVVAATCGHAIDWKFFLALPASTLATERARALLPVAYTRADAVHNVQRAGLLTAAFALNRPDVLITAMQDRIHQPYRLEACPLLATLLPLAGHDGILGVALSGAGPGILLVASPDADSAAVTALIRDAVGDATLEVLSTSLAPGATLHA